MAGSGAVSPGALAAPDGRARLLVCLLLSLLLHASLLRVVPGLPDWLAGAANTHTPPSPLAVTLAAAVGTTPAVSPAPTFTANVPPRPREAAAVAVKPITAAQPAPEAEAPSSRTAPTGLFPGPWYYPARYLHRRVTPLKPIWPDYPAEAEKVRGHVTILLLVNEEGGVDQYHIEDADPPGVFEESVIAAFTAARYAPALITGYKVKGQLLAEVSFEPGMPPRADFSIMDTARPLQGPVSSRGKEN